LEEVLAGIWQQLLKVERVGRHDNFFELGGHSLMALQLIALTRQSLNVDISVRELFAHPTPAALTLRFGRPDSKAFDVVLPLRETGKKNPIFCIHALSGLSWLYSPILLETDSDRPVFGIQARGLADSEPAISMNEMLTDYLLEIQRVQPRGPYHLVGYSFGGNVAHALATRLQQLGECVALLAILDATPSPEIDLESDQAQKNKTNDANPLVEKFHRVWDNNKKLLGDLDLGEFRGDVLLIRATESEEMIDPNEWSKYVSGSIAIYDIRCPHMRLGDFVHMREAAQVIASNLKRQELSSNA
jgi:thioesterase domain-containing protein